MKSSTEDRLLKTVDGATKTWLPLLMMGMAAWELVQAAMHPTVTAKAPSAKGAPEELQGTVQAVTVELTDPSFTDRVVASLPSALTLLMVVAAYGYLMWTGRSHDYDKKKATRALVGFGSAGMVIFLAPFMVVNIATKLHFDIALPASAFGLGSLLASGAFALVLIGAVGNRTDWMKEHDRARKLDAELENVV